MQTKEKQPQGSKARIEDIDGLTDPRRSIRPWTPDRQFQKIKVMPVAASVV